MVRSLSHHVRQVSEVWRWEGPSHVVLRAAGKILRPVVSSDVFYLFEEDLRRPTPEYICKIPVDLRIYSGEENIELVTEKLRLAGRPAPQEIESRLRDGNVVVVAYAEGRLAGFDWMSFHNLWVEEFSLTLRVQAGEAVVFDTFVLPEWRGRGIQSCLNHALRCHAQACGMVRTLTYISALNTQSLKAPKRMGSKKVMTIFSFRFRGMSRPWNTSTGAPLGSRFERN